MEKPKNDLRGQELLATITKEELVDWLHHPTTVKVHGFLDRILQQWSKDLVEGATLKLNSVEATAMQTTMLSARISGLRLALSLKDELNQEEEA